MTCKNCGNKIFDGADFCYTCGTRVNIDKREVNHEELWSDNGKKPSCVFVFARIVLGLIVLFTVFVMIWLEYEEKYRKKHNVVSNNSFDEYKNNFNPQPKTDYLFEKDSSIVINDNNAVSDEVFNKPEVLKPFDGKITNYTNKKRVAPFGIKNTFKDKYVYILLKDSKTKKKAISVFVYPNSNIKVDVPVGAYSMYYAVGKKWYGKDDLFGPDTMHSPIPIIIYNFYDKGEFVMGHEVAIKEVEVPSVNLYMPSLYTTKDDFK